ncbi:hypothetical protein GCM10022199_01810 [Marihabitans asiaticum]|uniref:Uncharacterized protein n=1 Tax=Marihabitans asiaticum TaxID=415218 RepID=A0A560WFR9_9MICO|nr:hypothetical protein [Marihabitans asiaticum]TWD16543.1 hypothetical protein FB557_0066 [Marihabitans asiaticum]
MTCGAAGGLGELVGGGVVVEGEVDVGVGLAGGGGVAVDDDGTVASPLGDVLVVVRLVEVDPLDGADQDDTGDRGEGGELGGSGRLGLVVDDGDRHHGRRGKADQAQSADHRAAPEPPGGA